MTTFGEFLILILNLISRSPLLAVITRFGGRGAQAPLCPANMLSWTAMIQPAFRFPSGSGTTLRSMEMVTTDEGPRTDTRLLVVEDEPNILDLLSASLRYAGFDVVTAAAGTEAVQAAQRHRPGLIA